jgi:hypothetical protein
LRNKRRELSDGCVEKKGIAEHVVSPVCSAIGVRSSKRGYWF